MDCVIVGKAKIMGALETPTSGDKWSQRSTVNWVSVEHPNVNVEHSVDLDSYAFNNGFPPLLLRCEKVGKLFYRHGVDLSTLGSQFGANVWVSDDLGQGGVNFFNDMRGR